MRVIVIFLVLAAIFVALYYILIAGLILITSRGHKENIKNNREALVYAVLGLFFIFMSFFFINLLGNFAPKSTVKKKEIDPLQQAGRM